MHMVAREDGPVRAPRAESLAVVDVVACSQLIG
jgi:hypothetical protein